MYTYSYHTKKHKTETEVGLKYALGLVGLRTHRRGWREA